MYRPVREVDGIFNVVITFSAIEVKGCSVNFGYINLHLYKSLDGLPVGVLDATFAFEIE
jgi:hypothetical protein